jgi:hypothetical protein
MMASVMKGWEYTAINGQLEKSIKFDTSIPAPTKSSLAKNQILIEVITAAINPPTTNFPKVAFLERW